MSGVASSAVGRCRWSTCHLFDPLSVPPLQALEKFTIEKDVAAYIKKEFDSKHGPTWHCIVGRNFGAPSRCLPLSVCKPAVGALRASLAPSAGSYVTHETKHFIYFYVGPMAVLLFKTG